MKMQYTEEQIARANQTDLVSFLNEQGEQLVKSGREYRWKKHDSVTISGNRWYRHSQSKGGYPVDFVMEFYYATFPEAVKMLIGEEGEGRQKSCPAPMWLNLINLTDSVTEERIISCLCLKQPLICSLLFSCFPKTGRNAAT